MVSGVGAGRAVGARSALAPLAIGRGAQAGDQRIVARLQGGWSPLRCISAQTVPTRSQVPPQAGAAALPRLRPSRQGCASWPPPAAIPQQRS